MTGIRNILIGFSVALVMSFTLHALPAPKYLSVPNFKSCTHKQKKGSASFLCLPASKPDSCPTSSWEMLTNGNMIPPC